MNDDSLINLGQFPRRTFEDLRLQTQEYLDNCPSDYFRFYLSHPVLLFASCMTSWRDFLGLCWELDLNALCGGVRVM